MIAPVPALVNLRIVVIYVLVAEIALSAREGRHDLLRLSLLLLAELDKTFYFIRTIEF